MSEDTTASEDTGSLGPSAPIAGLDVARLDSLRDLEPGDTTYLDRAIANFEVNSAAAMQAIREAVAAGDVATVKARSHKIAGSALNLGIPRAGEVGRAVEVAADSGSVEPVVVLLDELEDALATGRRLLLAYQATYSAS